MSSIAISCNNMTRIIGDIRAVDSLSLEIPAGIVFGFLGPNGAGKTTTIRLLLGLINPTEGSAEVLGFDSRTHSQKIRNGCGALLEHSGLYERLSAEDNLEYYGRIWKLDKPQRTGRIKELLTHLGLWERKHEQIRGWSRGMKQKLAVARALLHKPSLVFLDEPTAGLDPVASSALRDDLAGIVEREGTTVFLTTHNLQEAEKFCTQVGVINKGKLLACGPPDSLCSENNTDRLVIVGHNFSSEAIDDLNKMDEIMSVSIENGRMIIQHERAAPAAPVVNLLVGKGVRIEEVRKGKASLEETFLALLQEEGEL